MDKIDLTYSGKLDTYVTGGKDTLKRKKLYIDYTIDGITGKTTTTSILINDDPLLMITFDYQELKKIVESKGE